MDIARNNSSLDDIAAEIGFTATIRMAVFFGDRKQGLYVPEVADPSHELAALLGGPAFARLVAVWGRKTLLIPTLNQIALDRRLSLIRTRLLAGATPRMIALEVGLTDRRVQQIRRAFEDAGLIPLIFDASTKSA